MLQLHSTLMATSIFPYANSPKLQFLPHKSKSQSQSTVNLTSRNALNLKRLMEQSPMEEQEAMSLKGLHISCCCCCGCRRRHFMASIGGSFLLSPACAAIKRSDSDAETLNEIHPPRADWYEELCASVLANGMKSYEAEISDYKSQLFERLKGKAKAVLEIGVGTGPNLKYYADAGLHVFGVDPNKKMEKYARDAAQAAGLSPSDFEFIHAVGEALPVSDASVDAVIGTLVLCSVKDVHRTLNEVKRVLKPGGLYFFVEHVAAKDGTPLRIAQNILNPLQQLLSDGCHLTRDTGRLIAEAGFMGVESNLTSISSALFVNPHVYGVACK